MDDLLHARAVPSQPERRILYSSEGRSSLSAQLGAAHYSYRFAEGNFIHLLKALGYAPEPVDLPPYYGPHSWAATDRPGASPIHLIFRSPENIRTIAGCYNIAWFAWEFDVLKTDTLPFEHPFANQKRMLEACQEVWAPCDYTADILKAHGIVNTHRVPAPWDPPTDPPADTQNLARLAALRGVAAVQLKISNLVRYDTHSAVTSLTDSPAVKEAMAAEKLFVTVLNPHDKRKNLQELLLGFVSALAHHPEAALLVKLVLPPRPRANEVLLADIMPRFERPISLHCDRILFVCDFLSAEQMSALYGIANFYLCASVAEGQNLPLIEAMGHGTVPISTINTAMLDYLCDDNCIRIRTRRFSAFERRTGADVARRPYGVEFSSQTDIGRAVLRACALARGEVETLRQRALESVIGVFSTRAVGALVRQRIEAIQAASVHLAS
jgi:glycosyltransferase involved in cell wall biosynthesis